MIIVAGTLVDALQRLDAEQPHFALARVHVQARIAREGSGRRKVWLS